MDQLTRFNVFNILCLHLFIHPISYINAEFYFSKSNSPLTSPSYLYKHFTNIKEDNFPVMIRLSMSLSTFEGTLAYSIDQNMNSFLLFMKTSRTTENLTKVPFIRVEYRTSRGVFELIKLCGCQRECVGEKLDLIVWIKDQMEVQCNGGKLYKIKFGNEKINNTNYPVLSFPQNILTNQAHLWIWNHQSILNYHHDDRQMIGCLFELEYIGQPIEISKNGPDVNNICPRKCKNYDKNPCNDAVCIETYSESNLICDCTTSIYNGPRCDEKLDGGPVNIQMNLTDPLLKISWQTDNDVILEINKITGLDNNTFMCMKMIRKNSKLIIQLRNTNINGYIHATEITVTKKYNLNDSYSMILNITDKFITIQIPKLNYSQFLVNDFLFYSKDKIFVNGFGIIGFASKKNGQWENFSNYNILTLLTNSDAPSIITEDNQILIYNPIESMKFYIICLTVLLIINIILCILNGTIIYIIIRNYLEFIIKVVFEAIAQCLCYFFITRVFNELSHWLYNLFHGRFQCRSRQNQAKLKL